MMNATATAIFQTDLASSGKAAPEWIELFPAGPNIEARDGRKWTLDPQRVIAAFEANNGPLAIDYEHGQHHLARQGKPAPAAGWITALENRNGGIWGRVEWVAAAAKLITERAYRFISPDFDHAKDGQILRLNGAGLVNRPALAMTALAQFNPEQETSMLKAIAQALGLAEDATEAAILSAISTRDGERKALCQALKIEEKGEHTAVIAAIAKLQEDTATALAAVKTNGRDEEATTLRTELAETKTALAQLQEKDRSRDIDLALDTAQKAGKITPASRESYRAMCSMEGGLDKFYALVETLPQVIAPSELDGKVPATEGEGSLDPTALANEARKYVNEQAALGVAVSITDAVNHVKEKSK